jgi:hypothetical protein
MQTYACIDLHSSNNFIGVINAKDKRLYGKKHDNTIQPVFTALSPFRKTLQGVLVESTYNWYWLVDGLQEAGSMCFWQTRRPFSLTPASNTPMTNGTHTG